MIPQYRVKCLYSDFAETRNSRMGMVLMPTSRIAASSDQTLPRAGDPLALLFENQIVLLLLQYPDDAHLLCGGLARLMTQLKELQD